MANPLTGDYEAVVQLAIWQIDALLGALHQNADPNAPLKLLHSATARVGDPRRIPPDIGAFGDWVAAYQKAGPGQGLGAVRTELTATAPPGIVKKFSDAFVGFDQGFVVVLPPYVVRGLVQLQTSTVKITVADGSSSEVTIHADVRAQYYPDPDTTGMPQPIHGEVSAAFDITKAPHMGGLRLIIAPSADDAKIQFIPAPGSGLTAGDADTIATQVRTFLREGLVLLPVDLPVDVPFRDFKGLGSDANAVIALPFQLSGAASPPSGVQNISESFIGSSAFGFAASKEYVSTLIDLGAIADDLANQPPLVLTVGRWGLSFSVSYRLHFSSGPTLTFTNGGIQLAGSVAAHTDTSWAPDGYVSFNQLVTLDLNQTTQAVDLKRVGDPTVDQSWFIPHGTAVNIVRTQIDIALGNNGAAVSGVFANAKNTLTNGLRTFDTSADAFYDTVEITTDGVIVRGTISGQGRQAPVVAIEETQQGAAFTAFDSWIPSGRIDRFVWTWVEYTHPEITWSGVQKSVTDEHTFILPKPAHITNVSQICLRLEGTQINVIGWEVNVAGGTTCQVPGPDYAMDVPSWWEPLTIPFWTPNLVESDPLRQAIAGHISVQASCPGDIQPQRNALVYFVDGQRDRPLDALIEALRQTRNSSSIATTVVVPAGTFDETRREVEDRFGLTREGLPALQFTEDDEGGWTRTFAVSKTPSMYLMNARREFVWKHEGEPDPAEVAAALDKFVVPTPKSGFRPLRLTVSPGDGAPDATFEDGGHQYALHRLRGRAVLLNFWQSWSAPCLTELQRLQRLHQSGPQAPFIVAFHGGTSSAAVEETRKRLGLSYPLVQDSQQQIARTYGVRCWPTTITIDPLGRVEHVQFGQAHEHERPAGSDESTTTAG
jgi:peroxiredoxin